MPDSFSLRKGVFYMVLSGLSFFVVNLLVKFFSGYHGSMGDVQFIPPHELVFFRSIVSFVLSYAILRYQGLPVLGNNRPWLLLRGFSGLLALLLFFYSVQHLPMAIAATVQYLSPVFTIFLAMALLGEVVRKWQWLLILSAFSGTLVIGLSNWLGSGDAIGLSPFWMGVGVISAFFSGLAYTAIIKLKSTDSALQIVLYFPMVSIPVTGIWCGFDFVMPQGFEWLLLLLIGIFTQLAQVAMTRAFHFGDANSMSPIQYLGAIYALLAGFLLFDERLSLLPLCGIGLVLLGVVANLVSRRLED